MTRRVTISSVSDRGTHPLAFGEFRHRADAEGYTRLWTELSRQTGVTIKIEMEMTNGSLDGDVEGDAHTSAAGLYIEGPHGVRYRQAAGHVS